MLDWKKITSNAKLQEQRIIHAMIYFINNTEHCHLLKLLKLLYLLDLEILRLTGRSVTELEYQAWEKGPVPPKLRDDIQNPQSFLSNSIKVTKSLGPSKKDITFKPLIEFVSDFFSERELEQMKRLAEIYKDSKSKEMTAVTHQKTDEGWPWFKVYKKDANNRINLEDILESKKPRTISKTQIEFFKESHQFFKKVLNDE